MTEGESSSHLEELQHHDKYREDKERLSELVEKFNFELSEFRKTWAEEFDVDNITTQVISQMGYNIKRVEDDLSHASAERQGKQKGRMPVIDVGPGNGAPMNAGRNRETPYVGMVSPQNRKEMENTRVSSERSGLKSFFIEIVGDWNKELYVRYHDSDHVRRHSTTTRPLANLKNKSDQIRRGALKASIATRDSHTNAQGKKYNVPPGYQWTNKYSTPPQRLAEVNEDRDEVVEEDGVNMNWKTQEELEEEEVEPDFDEGIDYESDDKSDDESRYEIQDVGIEDLHQIAYRKRSREDDNGDELGQEKEESSRQKFKTSRID